MVRDITRDSDPYVIRQCPIFASENTIEGDCIRWRKYFGPHKGEAGSVGVALRTFLGMPEHFVLTSSVMFRQRATSTLKRVRNHLAPQIRTSHDGVGAGFWGTIIIP